MGQDGHFASIFPSIPIYKKLLCIKDKPAIYLVQKAGIPFCERITINLSMIMKSKKVVLLINTKKKLNRLRSAMLSGKDSNLPVLQLIFSLKNKINIIYKNNFIKMKK